MIEWLSDYANDLTLIQTLVWVGAAITIVTYLVKAYPVIRQFMRTIEALADLPDFMAKADRELTDNHGSSLKDAIRRIESSGVRTEKKLDEHIALCNAKGDENA